VTAIPKRPTARRAKARPLRNWHVAIIRRRLDFLGFVKAPDHAAAEAEAVKQFKLTEEQRRRLVIEERG
jgi:hypothetical protein